MNWEQKLRLSLTVTKLLDIREEIHLMNVRLVFEVLHNINSNPNLNLMYR